MAKRIKNWPKQDVLASKLRFDVKNPRLQYGVEGSLDQEQLYDLLVKDFDVVALAQQMKSDGFHNSEILIVTEERNALVVLDGNRRLAAFRYAHRLGWLDNSDDTLSVVVAPSREEADREIIVKHVGNLKKNWGTPDQLNKLREIVARSRGKTIEEIVEKYPSLGTERIVRRRLLNLEIYEFLLKSRWINSGDRSKIVKRGINMIDRFYTSKPGANHFSLHDLPYPFERERLQKIIDSPDSQRIVTEHIAGDTSAQITISEVERILKSFSGTSGKSRKRSAQMKRRTTDRKNLIPDGCRMAVKHSRVFDIYVELQSGIQVDEAPNAVAALFRIFMELSLDYYMKKKGIVQHGKNNVSIKRKTTLVTDYMKSNDIAEEKDLKNIRRVGSERDSYLSVEVFHEYMHSLKTKPEPLDLKTKWDNLEGFFEILWDDVS